MSLRPHSLARPLRRAPLRATLRAQCLYAVRNTHAPHLRSPQTSSFHTTSRRCADSHTPTHYDTLSLAPTATPGEIKRQFFTLSKKHHPDKNPDDPTASTRFVAISEAYHVLSVPEKRAQYDAQILQERSPGERWKHPSGSFSSASYAGSRPATGLNKRRSTFRGPPPSFYKSGGYGEHSAKRSEYAYQQAPGGASSKEGSQEAEGSYGQYGGFGPGQTNQGHEVPHFNDQKHKTMHDHVNDHIGASRRQRASEAASRRIQEEIERGGTTFVNFLLLSGVIAIIGLSTKVFGSAGDDNKRKEQS